MKKVSLVFLTLFFVSANFFVANAAFVTIEQNGEVLFNVLAYEDDLLATVPESESLQVTNIANNPGASASSEVYLKNEDGKVSLTVKQGGNETEKDLSNYSDDIVEIVQRKKAETVTIVKNDDGFSVVQKGFSADTTFPIKIDPESREVSLETPSGLRYLAILPFDAVERLVKANVISYTKLEKGIEITESDSGELLYKVPGERELNILNFLDYPVEVTASISATTGKLVEVDQPVWLRVLGFLFT